MRRKTRDKWLCYIFFLVDVHGGKLGNNTARFSLRLLGEGLMDEYQNLSSAGVRQALRTIFPDAGVMKKP